MPSSKRSTPDQVVEYLGINYLQFIPVLTQAIQEQQTLITELTDRLDAQQRQIDQLLNRD